MNNFTFEGKQKSLFTGMMVVGVVSMLWTFFLADDALHTRFWTNFLHNTVFFLGISFIVTFVMAAFTTAWGGWHTVLKRVWEAYSMFLIVGLGLMLVIIAGVWGGFHHLYHWNMEGIADINSQHYDRILAGKSGFLNKYWYTFGTILIVGSWYFFAQKIRSISIAEDRDGTQNFTYHDSMRRWMATFLPIAAFTSAAVIWQWVMSIDSHWYSTMFAWYATASWFVSAMAMTILMLIYLKSKGYYKSVTDEHLHDLGKFLFAFSIFWTYLWFSQYMLIWYSNNGEETVYFHTRMRQYPVLYYGNLIMNFFLPFLILMRNSTKRKYGTLIFVSILTLFGHWWDFFQMIKPGALHTAHEVMEAAAHEAGHTVAHHAPSFQVGFTIPGFLEIGTFIGFLGLFLYFVFNQLTKAALEPMNDPYIGESLHHHV